MALAVGKPSKVSIGALKVTNKPMQGDVDTPQDIQPAMGLNTVQKANTTSQQTQANTPKQAPTVTPKAGGGIGNMLKMRLFGKSAK